MGEMRRVLLAQLRESGRSVEEVEKTIECVMLTGRISDVLKWLFSGYCWS
jgi:hypothetical protein